MVRMYWIKEESILNKKFKVKNYGTHFWEGLFWLTIYHHEFEDRETGGNPNGFLQKAGRPQQSLKGILHAVRSLT